MSWLKGKAQLESCPKPSVASFVQTAALARMAWGQTIHKIIYMELKNLTDYSMPQNV